MTERTPQRHVLKCWPPYWRHVLDGIKRFEVRKDDRGFRSGDILVLREYSPGQGYSGATLTVRVIETYEGLPGVEDGYIIMTIAPHADD